MQPTNFQFQPVAYDIAVPPEEAINAGVEPEAMVTIVAGMPLPIPDPTTGGPVVIPFIHLQFPLAKEHLLKLGELALEKAAELPDPKPQSDLVIAGNMQQAEQAAQALQGFGSDKQ